MAVITIIPARGGSKGIPQKNIMLFCGKPLIAWSIEEALNARLVDDVYVTTDDKTIASISIEYGAKIINRPAEFATDSSSSEDALLHAIEVIESDGIVIDAVVFLQATSPIRESSDIDGAVKRFYEKQADSLFSSCLLEDYCIWSFDDAHKESITYDYKNRGNRQSRKPYFLENGSIYIFKPAILKKQKNRLGGNIEKFEMPFWKSYEIDSFDDIEICEVFMKKLFDTTGK
ncbi:MAG: acylneuraminate cytidylyltransferase family protein [Bacteroidales bacterium]|jgi:N-acylneuraminate cytidylyltransferase|nr:acylneuraminate cytidylyltransferase family protein [Bacteroidales bacterium]